MLRDRTLSSWPFHWATDGAGWGGGVGSGLRVGGAGSALGVSAEDRGRTAAMSCQDSLTSAE